MIEQARVQVENVKIEETIEIVQLSLTEIEKSEKGRKIENDMTTDGVEIVTDENGKPGNLGTLKNKILKQKFEKTSFFRRVQTSVQNLTP